MKILSFYCESYTQYWDFAPVENLLFETGSLRILKRSFHKIRTLSFQNSFRFVQIFPDQQCCCFRYWRIFYELFYFSTSSQHFFFVSFLDLNWVWWEAMGRKTWIKFFKEKLIILGSVEKLWGKSFPWPWAKKFKS